MFSLGVLLAGLVAIQPDRASAQAPDSNAKQEKRIALVIGNGAYQKEPLATAANDAGLIAQTLQAAGFDVVGARDLDGNTLRSSFRDFVKKAEESGPDTVAVVYLSGYAMQLAGENYYIPVDTTITRDTDIPIEGLRLSDYMRQLSALPLKVSVFVVDGAREQPFIEGGQPIASGLALVEPDPHMLIAFNAAPGTVAPEEEGPYGAYAQSLAEMIRTGGLSLPEVFDRVRLRVNENTKGGQVPWDTQKVDAQFTFFDRAPDAPAPAEPDRTAALRDKPIKDLGASDAYTAALGRDTIQGYEDFLGAYPDDPMAKRVRAIAAARREAITWRRTYRANTPDSYWSYLKRYPNGPHAADARRRLAILAAALEPPPSFAMMDYDLPPPPPEEIVYVDRPVLMFSDPYFDFAPPPPPPVYYLPPPPPDFIELAPPLIAVGLFILPRPIFVPIPVYVRPPRYIRPPRNNIIFANIHNARRIETINRPGPGFVRPMANGRPVPVIANPKAKLPADAQRAGPALPSAVTRRANLIRQGKAPVPQSASIRPAVATAPADKSAAPRGPRGPRGSRGPNGQREPNANPAQRPGAPPSAARPGQPSPSNQPAAVRPGQPAATQPAQTDRTPGRERSKESPKELPKELPKANTLPVPGAKGAPPALDRRPGPAVGGPAGRGPDRGPDARGPGRDRPDRHPPGAAPTRPGAPGAATPAVTPRPGPAVTAPSRPGVPPKPAVAPRPAPPPQAHRPGPPPRVAPPPRAAPPRAAPPRAAPPPRMAPPRAPPPRAAPPPRPAPVARPAPPRMAPPPRPAAPPRAAPPPRMAPPRAPPPRAAPPPRPAPAARAAPAKRCAPGAKC